MMTNSFLDTGKPVLVVEDDKSIRDLLVMALTIEGFSTISAENGVEALEILHTTKPGLILLDLMMPVMNGWEFLGVKNSDLTISGIPVVLLSAVAPAGGGLPGVACCLKKPIELGDLKAAVTRYLRAPGDAPLAAV